jgi:hypothetical protein
MGLPLREMCLGKSNVVDGYKYSFVEVGGQLYEKVGICLLEEIELKERRMRMNKISLRTKLPSELTDKQKTYLAVNNIRLYKHNTTKDLLFGGRSTVTTIASTKRTLIVIQELLNEGIIEVKNK